MIIKSIGILPFPCYWIILVPGEAFSFLLFILSLIYLLYGIYLFREGLNET
ncbi:MAG: hypothetical protein ACFFCV_21675 [Promethearchaeota archaeon]